MYNSGVVLLRPNNATYRAMVHALHDEHLHYVCHDGSQHLFNRLVGSRLHCVHLTFNCRDPVFMKARTVHAAGDRTSCLRESSLPHVVHFAAGMKPWLAET